MMSTIQYRSEDRVSQITEKDSEEKFDLAVEEKRHALACVTIHIANPIDLDAARLS